MSTAPPYSTPDPLVGAPSRSVSASTTRSDLTEDLDCSKPGTKLTLKHLSNANVEVDESVVRAEGEDRTTLFVWWLVIAAATGGLLFGYDTGVIGGALVHKDITADLHRTTLSSGAKEILTSATTLGALLAGFTSGRRRGSQDRHWPRRRDLHRRSSHASRGFRPQRLLGHGRRSFDHRFRCRFRFPRRPVSTGPLSPPSQRDPGLTSDEQPVHWRALADFAPWSPRHAQRRRHHVWPGLRLLHQLGVPERPSRLALHGWPGRGSSRARSLDLFTSNPFSSFFIPQILQLLLLGFLPESPRYLLRRDKLEETVNILRKVYPYATEEQLHLKAEVIRDSVKANMGHQASFIQTWKRLHFVGANFRGLIIACGLQGIQQLCGFNTLMYYAPTLFESVGFKNSLVIGLVISIVNFVFTLVALVIIDRVGRRRIACVTVPGMCGALIVAAVAFHYLTLNTGGKLPDNGVGVNEHYAPLILTAMLVYVAFYASGIGNIPWQQGELFEMDVRGMGTAFSTTCNWGGNLIIGSTFLSLIDRITAAGAFGFYAGLCFLGTVFVIALYPETSGLSLEETREVFQNGFGIQKANRMRIQKQAALAEVRAAEVVA
ncbi:SPOSA6832_01955, partial [Sporobolomyces salmonicolor]